MGVGGGGRAPEVMNTIGVNMVYLELQEIPRHGWRGDASCREGN